MSHWRELNLYGAWEMHFDKSYWEHWHANTRFYFNLCAIDERTKTMQ